MLSDTGNGPLEYQRTLWDMNRHRARSHPCTILGNPNRHCGNSNEAFYTHVSNYCLQSTSSPNEFKRRTYSECGYSAISGVALDDDSSQGRHLDFYLIVT